jgi:hypothetical protein
MLCPLLALAAVALTASPARADDNEGKNNDMSGAWQFLLVIDKGPASFSALGTFTKDGIFVGTAQGDGLCCSQAGISQGAAHGTWKRIGSRSFTWTLRALQVNADLSLASILTVIIAVTLDQPNQVSGSWSGQVAAPNGSVLQQVGGSITGFRYAIP